MDLFGAQDTILWYKKASEGHIQLFKITKNHNMDFKNLKKKSSNQKSLDFCQMSRDFCQMFVISIKKTISQGMDLKIYRKSVA